ncbi:MAG TPA: glycosyltransferase family 87 protein [Thermoanaerobaculia bacterium]
MKWALLLISIAALAIRVIGLTGPGGALGAPTGYDDGVYFSASALLLRGVLPYRDFVFVHPPGVLYFFSLTSWLPNPAEAFVAARFLATIVGAVSTFLVGHIVMRAAGPFAGLVAAFLYATYPDALGAERTTFLEPVLNLAALAAAHVWLGNRRRPFVAGVLAGAACAVKLWGGIWVLAALASAPNRKDIGRFLLGGILAGVVLLAPVALPALDGFIAQTLQFQLSRPPDGVASTTARLQDIFDSGHRAASVLAIVGLLAMLRTRTREERFFAVATVLTVLGFLASSSYWNHYNSHLAASQCVLAGLGAAALLRLPRIPRAATAAAVVLLIAALDFQSIRTTIRNAPAASPEMLTARYTIPTVVPKNEPVFAFDPTWTLVAGHLPPHGDGAPAVVDSYGAMLLTAVQGGGRFGDTGAAFQSPVAQPAVRARLAASRYVVLGWRGNWQLNAAERDWFFTRFQCANPEAAELCVWERRAQPGAPVSVDAEKIVYGDGWHGEEGTLPKRWRWMGRRSVTTLPARSGTAYLQLEFAIPLDSLKQAPTLTVELDGRVLDRFPAPTAKVRRGWKLTELHGDAPHTLVISSDRAFVPAQLGKSADTRELAVSLTDLTWRRVDASTSWSP